MEPIEIATKFCKTSACHLEQPCHLCMVQAGMIQVEIDQRTADALLQVGRYRDALKRIDAMRKRLPDPDFNEQKTTAAGIAEVIREALVVQRRHQRLKE